MSYAELFESGEKKQAKGHLKNLIIMAKADGILDAKEEKLLRYVARRLHISDEAFEDVMNSPEKYTVNPPANKWNRYERFIHLVKMVIADGDTDFIEEEAIYRLGIGLGLPGHKIAALTDKVKHELANDEDADDIAKALDKMLN